MPIIKSAKKRVRVTKRTSVENARTKRRMKETIKSFQAALAAKKDTTQIQSEAYSAIDTAAKKGVISKSKAARKKSQLNTASKAAGTTKAGSKKTAKPAAKKSTSAKKPATKKTAPASKTAAKKPAAKKTATKKSSTKKSA